MKFTETDTIQWLKEADENKLRELRIQADSVRKKHVGEEIHLRGLLEISNYCRRNCKYCGINAGNKTLKRYRMSEDEILEGARIAERLGYGTIVIQSGEDPKLTRPLVGRIVRRIKEETGRAVTLSLGERTLEDLEYWRTMGADRYLLRFETSDTSLYEKIHPPFNKSLPDRFAILKILRTLGYEVGSGIMIGIPGQTYASLAQDIRLFHHMDLDMVGVGPFIPHPGTELGSTSNYGKNGGNAEEQVPATIEMTLKALALTRLVCPDTNLPATTALATVSPKGTGRIDGLSSGANVIMPNITPLKYRALYEIYPSKASRLETPDETNRVIMECIRSAGRKPGTGNGDSPKYLQRTKADKK